MNNPLVQPDPGLYIWTIVTFLVLVALLAKFAWRPLLAALDDAAAGDPQVARRRAAGQAGAGEGARRLGQDPRAGARRGRGHRVGHPDRREPVPRGDAPEGARRGDGIVKNAERQIEQETARALQQIRHEAVDLSVTIASKLLQRNVSKDDNARLIEDTFKQIEASERPS